MLNRLFASLVISLVVCSWASGGIITVDPGAVGSVFQTKVISFDDLNGTPLDGRNLTLDFVFADSKNLKPIFADADSYSVQVQLVHDPITTQTISPSGGFLSDELGNPIASPAFRFAAAGPQVNVYILQFDNAVDGLVHHDVHFDFRLPNAPSATITSALLAFQLNGGTQGEIQVGTGTSGVVPEPASIAILGFGALGMSMMGRRRRKTGATERTLCR